jgi:hypothetical protein
MKEAVAGLRQPLMSALGQKRTLKHVQSMSALPPKADIVQRDRDDIRRDIRRAETAFRLYDGGYPSAWQKL